MHCNGRMSNWEEQNMRRLVTTDLSVDLQLAKHVNVRKMELLVEIGENMRIY